MPVLTCPSAERMRSYTLGQLSEPESDEIFEHFQSCESCRRELETVGDASDSLIVSLRETGEPDHALREPGCQRAVAKALGALALAEQEEAKALDAPMLPKEIGEYEIVRPLGRGGMGSVYLARHTKLGREVAVKVLTAAHLASPRHRERFEVEMRAIGRLSHPNIVTAHDAREVDGTAVLVMEYIAGFDLSQLVARTGPLKTADACELVRRVAIALQYTSDQGFVHRDIKPSNIMLSREGDVKLLDLGLARLQTLPPDGVEITGTGQAMGTADYIAPEQIADSRRVDVRTDIYALGCTLFKLLAGTPPFSGDAYPTTFSKMTAHVSTPPPSLAQHVAGLPPGLVRLVEAMLAKSPDQRPQTPLEVAERLTGFAEGADLISLVTLADESPARDAAAITGSAAAAVATSPSWWKGSTPRPIAVAMAFSGFFIGLCLGVIVTITFPDGSKLVAEGGDGTRVDVAHSGAAQANAAAASSGTEEKTDARQSRRTDTSTSRAVVSVPELPGTAPEAGFLGAPLQFAILVEESDVSDAALQVARHEVMQGFDPFGPDSQVVVSDAGIWYPLAHGVEAPVSSDLGGARYALVSRKEDQRILWGDVFGQVQTAQSSSGGGFPREGGRPATWRGARVELHFGPALADQLDRLSRRNLQRRLAVIVSDKIVFTPIIQGVLSQNVVLTGLTREEAQFLVNATTSGIAEPLQQPGRTMAAPPRDAAANAAASPIEQLGDNLKQIGLAFHNFHDVYRKFPGPANTLEGSIGRRDKKIYPFSWRVAILPFVEQAKLFETYRFDEPWDSEANKKLLERMPEVFRHPMAEDDVPIGHTNYLGVARDGSAMGTGGGVPIRDFIDGTSNTLLLIETTESVPWTKPQDIEGEVQLFPGRPTFMVLADGAVRTLDPADPETLEKVITRAGNEVVKLGNPVNFPQTARP